MKRLSPESLYDPGWHPWLCHVARRKRWISAEHVIPLLLIGFFLWFGWWIVAAVVASISVILLVVAATRPADKKRFDRWIEVFATWIAKVISCLLLAPIFYGLLPLVRIWHIITGHDPLRLRWENSPSFWHQAEGIQRRSRYSGAMFCAEPPSKGKLAIVPLLAIGVFALLLIEGGLRIYGLGHPLKFIQDPDVGYYPAAHQVARYPGRIVTTNNLGMRSPDVILPKPPGMLRILLVGDSTLAGTKVSNEDLYSALLQKRLQTRIDANIEVLNLGVNAWGPQHQLGFIEKFGIFGADVVIICGPVANVYRPKYGLERVPFFPIGKAPRTALGHLGYELIWRARERTLGPPAWTMESPTQDALAAKGVEAYAAMAEIIRNQGAEMLVEMMPARNVMLSGGHDPFSERMFEPIHRRLKRMGVEANLAGGIFVTQTRKDEVFYDGVHFDELGHELYAQYLAGRIEETSKAIRSRLHR